MKTPDALYEAKEAVLAVHKAMSYDTNDRDTKIAGHAWLREHYSIITKAYQLLSDAIDSYNDHERGE